MTFYEDIVTQAQMNFTMFRHVYSMGSTPIKLSEKVPLPYEEQIKSFAKQVEEADCIIVGGASGLSAAGGGDFYYEDNESYRKYFGKYAEKYGFKGAFAGTSAQWDSREEFWGYIATFLHTTQNAEARKPYVDLDIILKGKDFFILTTNQDTQFLRLYQEEKVAEIQGDHRFFQCARCCCDDTWDAIEPVNEMIEAMGEDTGIPTELIPKCPHCGGEAFPWVRGYGNFLQGKKYHEEYGKISNYILKNKNKKLLFIELGVGRITPMFIQEPFWFLTEVLPDASYIGVNDKYEFLPEAIEDKGMAIVEDISKVLEDLKKEMSR